MNMWMKATKEVKLVEYAKKSVKECSVEHRKGRYCRKDGTAVQARRYKEWNCFLIYLIPTSFFLAKIFVFFFFYLLQTPYFHIRNRIVIAKESDQDIMAADMKEPWIRQIVILTFSPASLKKNLPSSRLSHSAICYC